MNRRAFIRAVVSTAASWPMTAKSQNRRPSRTVGILITAPAVSAQAQLNLASFRAELAKQGWADGQNLKVYERWVTGDTPSVQPVATEFTQALRPDVILVTGPGALGTLKVTGTSIPIVFVSVSDPVGQGFVRSFAQPGGTITGFTSFDFERAGKLLEILHEAAPKIERIGLVYSPNNPNADQYVRSLQEPARSLKIELATISVRTRGDIERGIASFAGTPNGGLLIPPNYITSVHRDLIFALASHHGLPAIYPEREYAVEGGLIAYGPDRRALYRNAAGYVSRILKGEMPSDLPVQSPTKFELLINLKAAKAIGLPIPPTLVALADEIIE